MKHPATSRTTRRRAFAAASVTAFGLTICGWSSAHVQAAPTPAETLSVETAGDIPEAADASNIAPEVVKGLIAVGYAVQQAALAGKAAVPVVVVKEGKAVAGVSPIAYQGTTPGFAVGYVGDKQLGGPKLPGSRPQQGGPKGSPTTIAPAVGYVGNLQSSPSKAGAVDPSDVEFLLD